MRVQGLVLHDIPNLRSRIKGKRLGRVKQTIWRTMREDLMLRMACRLECQTASLLKAASCNVLNRTMNFPKGALMAVLCIALSACANGPSDESGYERLLNFKVR